MSVQTAALGQTLTLGITRPSNWCALESWPLKHDNSQASCGHMSALCFSFVQHQKACSCQDAQRAVKTIFDFFQRGNKNSDPLITVKEENILRVKYCPPFMRCFILMLLVNYYD